MQRHLPVPVAHRTHNVQCAVRTCTVQYALRTATKQNATHKRRDSNHNAADTSVSRVTDLNLYELLSLREEIVLIVSPSTSRKMSKAIPNDLRNLRACLLCSMVKSYEQFSTEGCDNCEEILPMRGQREAVQDYTSSNFDGLIAMMNPSQSWVAKWQRLDKFTPGLYAVSVSGSLPKDAVRELKSQGINYKPRDSTQGPGR